MEDTLFREKVTATVIDWVENLGNVIGFGGGGHVMCDYGLEAATLSQYLAENVVLKKGDKVVCDIYNTDIGFVAKNVSLIKTTRTDVDNNISTCIRKDTLFSKSNVGTVTAWFDWTGYEEQIRQSVGKVFRTGIVKDKFEVKADILFEDIEQGFQAHIGDILQYDLYYTEKGEEYKGYCVKNIKLIREKIAYLQNCAIPEIELQKIFALYKFLLHNKKDFMSKIDAFRVPTPFDEKSNEYCTTTPLIEWNEYVSEQIAIIENALKREMLDIYSIPSNVFFDDDYIGVENVINEISRRCREFYQSQIGDIEHNAKINYEIRKSQITGLPFGIITNSLVSAMEYELRNAIKITREENKLKKENWKMHWNQICILQRQVRDLWTKLYDCGFQDEASKLYDHFCESALDEIGSTYTLDITGKDIIEAYNKSIKE